jgi:hypothetical protein
MIHNAKCEICENADIHEMRKHMECEYMRRMQNMQNVKYAKCQNMQMRRSVKCEMCEM